MYEGDNEWYMWGMCAYGCISLCFSIILIYLVLLTLFCYCIVHQEKKYTLFTYVMVSARSDMLNMHKSEHRHTIRKVSWQNTLRTEPMTRWTVSCDAADPITFPIPLSPNVKLLFVMLPKVLANVANSCVLVIKEQEVRWANCILVFVLNVRKLFSFFLLFLC